MHEFKLHRVGKNYLLYANYCGVEVFKRKDKDNFERLFTFDFHDDDTCDITFDQRVDKLRDIYRVATRLLTIAKEQRDLFRGFIKEEVEEEQGDLYIP